MKVTTRPIHKIAVIVPVDYRFEDDQGPPATERERATREASPPPETARVQELPRSFSWADEMEEEYELNGPPPDLEPGEVSWAVQDHDNAPRGTDASRRGRPETAGRPARDLWKRPVLQQEPLVKRGRIEATPETQRTAKKGSHDCCGRSATDFPAPSERPAVQNSQLDEEGHCS